MIKILNTQEEEHDTSDVAPVIYLINAETVAAQSQRELSRFERVKLLLEDRKDLEAYWSGRRPANRKSARIAA